MKGFWTLALLLAAGYSLAACSQTPATAPVSAAAPSNGTQLGNSGVRVSGYAEAGATGTAR